MLKVTIAVEPFGCTEQTRIIYEIKIANLATDEFNYADYSIICKGKELKRRLGTRLEDFDREKGAIALVKESLEVLLEHYPHKLKDPRFQ